MNISMSKVFFSPNLNQRFEMKERGHGSETFTMFQWGSRACSLCLDPVIRNSECEANHDDFLEAKDSIS